MIARSISLATFPYHIDQMNFSYISAYHDTDAFYKKHSLNGIQIRKAFHLERAEFH